MFRVKKIECDESSGRFLLAEEGDGCTTFTGHPVQLQKLMSYIGDEIWPSWRNDKGGPEAYGKYFDKCKAGSITCAHKHFLEKAWPKVKKHLKTSEISVFIIRE